MWNPWRRLGELSHVTLLWEPGFKHRGLTTFATDTIQMRTGMLQAERRSTLTHELVHLERGPFPRWKRPREERLVDAEAARRLIPFDRLADAMVWSGDEFEAAEELWVDVRMVRARLGSLTKAERLELNRRLDVWEEEDRGHHPEAYDFVDYQDG